MKKLTLIFVCVLTLLLAVCGTEAASQTIRVSDARGFLEALGSDRVIEMMPGVYNLSERDPYLNGGELKPADGVTWEKSLDGGEFVLERIENLTIRGMGFNRSNTVIVIEPRYAFVLTFRNCADIAIENVTAGHTEEGNCIGGVFSFADSSRITITDTRMFGCGTEGLALSDVSGMKVTGSAIDGCTYYIMTVTDGGDIVFDDCAFTGNRQFTLVNVTGTRNMSFSKCRFDDNRGQMFEVEGTDISVSNSSFSRNNADSPIQDSPNVELINCEFVSVTVQDIEAAIKAGMDVNAATDGWTHLMIAARYDGDPQILSALIKAGADVNAKSDLGETPLAIAAEYDNNPEVLNVLIQAGADANAKSNYGATPLQQAAIYNRHPEVVNVLIQAGADVNFRNNIGFTPLMYAAAYNSAEVLSALIQAGADVNAEEKDGSTALTKAAEKREPEIVEILLAAGATVSENDVERAQKNERLRGAGVIEELKSRL